MNLEQITSQIQSRLNGYSDLQVKKFVQSVCRELAEKGDEQWALARWRLLIQSLSHHRFEAAVFRHTFSASFLAHSEQPKLAREIMALEKMTPDKFARFIDQKPEKHNDPARFIDQKPERHNDPEVSSPRLPQARSLSVTFRLPEEAGSSSTEDAASEGRLSRVRGQSV